MKKQASLLILISVLMLPTGAMADVLTGTTSWDFSPNPGVELDLTVDTDTNMVDIVMSGRTDGWFGIGFGASIMNGTYGIVVHQDGSYDERDLNYGGGAIIDSSLTLVSSDISGTTRTMHFQRDRVGMTAEHYTFQTTPGLLPLIGASAAGGYAYHGGTNRAPGSVMLSAIPEPVSGLLLAVGLCGALRLRRR